MKPYCNQYKTEDFMKIQLHYLRKKYFIHRPIIKINEWLAVVDNPQTNFQKESLPGFSNEHPD